MTKAVVAGLMVVCLLVLPSGASARATTTTVTIRAEEGGGFFGYVKTKGGTCESGRKVTLYKQKGSRKDRSRDQRIGTDTAQPNGPDSMWAIGTAKSGKYYAYVKSTSRCAAAYSRTVSSIEPA